MRKTNLCLLLILSHCVGSVPSLQCVQFYQWRWNSKQTDKKTNDACEGLQHLLQCLRLHSLSRVLVSNHLSPPDCNFFSTFTFSCHFWKFSLPDSGESFCAFIIDRFFFSLEADKCMCKQSEWISLVSLNVSTKPPTEGKTHTVQCTVCNSVNSYYLQYIFQSTKTVKNVYFNYASKFWALFECLILVCLSSTWILCKLVILCGVWQLWWCLVVLWLFCWSSHPSSPVQ